LLPTSCHWQQFSQGRGNDCKHDALIICAELLYFLEHLIKGHLLIEYQVNMKRKDGNVAVERPALLCRKVLLNTFPTPK
jgi:hypothetical protein